MTPSISVEDLLDHCLTNGHAAELGTMFRSPALRSQGKVFAFLGHGGALIVKLHHERITRLASECIAEQVTMGKRTMREWAEVYPLADGDATFELWCELTVEAHRFVSSAQKK